MKPGKRGRGGLFDLVVDSITDDEEVFETVILLNGDEDFRLEIEEKEGDDGLEIAVSIYRAFRTENARISLNIAVDFEVRDGAYRFAGDESGKRMALDDVYGEIMLLVRRAVKVRLE